MELVWDADDKEALAELNSAPAAIWAVVEVIAYTAAEKLAAASEKSAIYLADDALLSIVESHPLNYPGRELLKAKRLLASATSEKESYIF